MNYIVLDLEWNQCPYGKEYGKKALPFEIIEIGAVKLDEDRNMVDEFHRVIKPKEYKKIHYKTQKVIHLTQEQLKSGVGFPQAMEEFFAWCSPQDTFCTWGISDLTELQRNMDYFKVKNVFPKPLYYYDIQELMAVDLDERDKRRTLESAVEYYRIKKEREFHGAAGDAFYTAKILQALHWEKVRIYYTFNCYRNPRNKEEEITAIYPDGSKFVSREFATKERAMKDRSLLTMQCFQCGRNLRSRIKWFASQQKVYESIYKCPKHGLMLCKIRFKSLSNGNYFAVRSIEAADDAAVQAVLDRKEQIKIRRRRRNGQLRRRSVGKRV